jgi:anti-sigma regulatory factor (Ser/Thr protein kinase)
MNAGTGLTESYPAVAGSVPRAREALVALARAAGADDDQAEAVRLGASEALTNAVVHAYGAGSGDIHVTAAANDGELWMLIADDGVGLRARPTRPGLGMGLALIACVTDYFAVVRRSGGGTEVRMRFAISATDTARGDYSRGSVFSANAPARSRFSTIT